MMLTLQQPIIQPDQKSLATGFNATKNNRSAPEMEPLAPEASPHVSADS